MEGTQADGESLLMQFCRKQQLEDLKLLIAQGYQVNKQGKRGLTPLMYAAINNFVEGAKILIRSGAYINQTDNVGFTARKYAEQNGSQEVINLFNSPKMQVVAQLQQQQRQMRLKQLANMSPFKLEMSQLQNQLQSYNGPRSRRGESQSEDLESSEPDNRQIQHLLQQIRPQQQRRSQELGDLNGGRSFSREALPAPLVSFQLNDFESKRFADLSRRNSVPSICEVPGSGTKQTNSESKLDFFPIQFKHSHSESLHQQRSVYHSHLYSDPNSYPDSPLSCNSNTTTHPTPAAIPLGETSQKPPLPATPRKVYKFQNPSMFCKVSQSRLSQSNQGISTPSRHNNNQGGNGSGVNTSGGNSSRFESNRNSKVDSARFTSQPPTTMFTGRAQDWTRSDVGDWMEWCTPRTFSRDSTGEFSLVNSTPNAQNGHHIAWDTWDSKISTTQIYLPEPSSFQEKSSSPIPIHNSNQVKWEEFFIQKSTMAAVQCQKPETSQLFEENTKLSEQIMYMDKMIVEQQFSKVLQHIYQNSMDADIIFQEELVSREVVFNQIKSMVQAYQHSIQDEARLKQQQKDITFAQQVQMELICQGISEIH